MYSSDKRKQWMGKIEKVFDQIANIEKTVSRGVANGPISFIPYIISLYDQLDDNQILIYKATTNLNEIEMHETYGYACYDCADKINVYQNVDKFLTTELDFLKYSYEGNDEDDYYTEHRSTITNSRCIQNLPKGNQIIMDHEYKLFSETDSVCISKEITVLSKNTESIRKIISFIKDNGKKN